MTDRIGGTAKSSQAASSTGRARSGVVCVEAAVGAGLAAAGARASGVRGEQAAAPTTATTTTMELRVTSGGHRRSAEVPEMCVYIQRTGPPEVATRPNACGRMQAASPEHARARDQFGGGDASSFGRSCSACVVAA
jgi:hypothetical protein